MKTLKLFITIFIMSFMISSIHGNEKAEAIELRNSTTTIASATSNNQNEYIWAYVVDNNIYFQQKKCAERRIENFGGEITGREYVKRSQALVCADLPLE